MALEACRRRIAAEPSSICLVGGVDSYLDPDTLDWLAGEEQLKAQDNPHGLIPGEAASFVLVAGEGAARGQPGKLPQVLSVGIAGEMNTRRSGTVCAGSGLSAALKQACSGCTIPGNSLDWAVCDLNGEPYRADEFGFTLVRFSRLRGAAWDFQTPADSVGDVGAASGPLFVGLAASRRIGRAAPEHVLLLTSSETGERAAAIVRTT